MGSLVFVVFILLMLLRVPVTFSIALAALAAFLYAGFGNALYVMPQQIIDGVDNSSMISIPFFVLAGNLMNAVGVTDRIFGLALVLVGRFRAGLAQVNVLATAIFSGISGSALADIAGLGAVQVKAMSERGYSKEFAAALTVASAVMAPVIPPSIAFIVYSALANTSVARMFLAGIVPGILIALFLMIFNRILAVRHDFPREKALPLRESATNVLRGLPALGAPAIILAGTIGGFVTVAEAGVLASGYTLLLGACYRTLDRRKLWSAATETTLVSALIMMIIGFSKFLGWILTIDQVPQNLALGMVSLTSSPAVFILLCVIFLLVVGCFVESAPAKLILVPILLPAIDRFGVDRVHFGVVLTLALAIGIAHPPMGVGLFVVTRVSDISLERVTVAILPLLVPLLVVLLLISFVPQLTLWLPNLVMGAE
jgi:tripartite ATP-independent transporter DctM subunit